MSKKTCFTIFVITTIVIITAFILKISTITTHIESIFHAMKHPYLAVSALIIAFLLRKQKHYLLLMIGCSVVTATILQMFITGSGFAIIPIIYKAAAFLVYTYLTMLIRFMI